MPRTQCPDCGKEIPDNASVCNECSSLIKNSNYRPEDILPSDLIDSSANIGVPDNSFKPFLASLVIFILVITTVQIFIAYYKPPVEFRTKTVEKTPPLPENERMIEQKQFDTAFEIKPAKINGYNSESKAVNEYLNVFLDFNNMSLGKAGSVKHGETVEMLDIIDGGVKIRTKSGLTGWIAKRFIEADLNKTLPPVGLPLRQTKTSNAGKINGFDSSTGSIIDPINIFKDYDNRNAGINGKASHGESVTILEKSGNGVKIKTSSGVTGWVSSWFVKEN